MIRKTINLLRVLRHSRTEFLDRVVTVAEGRLAGAPGDRGIYDAIPSAEWLRVIEASCGVPLEKYLHDPALADIENRIRRLLCSSDGVVPSIFDADPLLARSCYLICRARQPNVVIETGVSHGVSSAYILQALAANGRGRLLSIDLPPLGSNPEVEIGQAVPRHLRARWELHLGPSKRLLARLAALHGPVDLFIHDSLHTYRNVKAELEAVRPYLAEDALVLADDIENNRAFLEWSARPEVGYNAAVWAGGKAAMFGVSRYRTQPVPQAANR